MGTISGDTLSQSTAELLISAVRRALPLILVLMAFGAAAVNLQRQLQGPVYSATARVFLSTTDIGALVAGVQPSFVDSQRVLDNALSLARSPALYERAAESVEGLSATELREITNVSGSDDADLLFFTVEHSDPETVSAAANAVASEFPEWRADITTASIQEAVTRLEREIATTSPEDRDALEADLRQLKLLETLTTGNAVLVEEADEALKISPNPGRDSLLGVSIGLVIALLFAGAREILDTRVRSEAEVEELLDAPIVASIGRLPRRASLVTVGRYAQRFGDSYALLAANLMQMRKQDEPTVIAVTSATKQEGKSITAANLAVALAQRDAQVIVADFDLRRSSLGPIFGIPNGSPGVVQTVRDNLPVDRALLAVALNGDVSPRRARPPLIPDTSTTNGGQASSLRILPAGGTIRGTLSHFPRVQDLIAQLATQAEIVIIDTPPALATADMADLSPFVDIVLVVSRQGRATRRSLAALARQAHTWKAGISGVVVTDTADDGSYYYDPS